MQMPGNRWRRIAMKDEGLLLFCFPVIDPSPTLAALGKKNMKKPAWQHDPILRLAPMLWHEDPFGPVRINGQCRKMQTYAWQDQSLFDLDPGVCSSALQV